MHYHVAIDGKASGPFNVNEVRARIINGEVDATTLVWANGMVEWKPAGSIAAFNAQFNSDQPPPLPSS